MSAHAEQSNNNINFTKADCLIAINCGLTKGKLHSGVHISLIYPARTARWSWHEILRSQLLLANLLTGSCWLGWARITQRSNEGKHSRESAHKMSFHWGASGAGGLLAAGMDRMLWMAGMPGSARITSGGGKAGGCCSAQSPLLQALLMNWTSAIIELIKVLAQTSPAGKLSQCLTALPLGKHELKATDGQFRQI